MKQDRTLPYQYINNMHTTLGASCRLIFLLKRVVSTCTVARKPEEILRSSALFLTIFASIHSSANLDCNRH